MRHVFLLAKTPQYSRKATSSIHCYHGRQDGLLSEITSQARSGVSWSGTAEAPHTTTIQSAEKERPRRTLGSIQCQERRTIEQNRRAYGATKRTPSGKHHQTHNVELQPKCGTDSIGEKGVRCRFEHCNYRNQAILFLLEMRILSIFSLRISSC